jgi:hypothetical protein
MTAENLQNSQHSWFPNPCYPEVAERVKSSEQNTYAAVALKISTLAGLANVKNINPTAKRNVKIPITPIRRPVLWIVERIAIAPVGRRQAIKLVAADRTPTIGAPKFRYIFNEMCSSSYSGAELPSSKSCYGTFPFLHFF